MFKVYLATRRNIISSKPEPKNHRFFNSYSIRNNTEKNRDRRSKKFTYRLEFTRSCKYITQSLKTTKSISLLKINNRWDSYRKIQYPEDIFATIQMLTQLKTLIHQEMLDLKERELVLFTKSIRKLPKLINIKLQLYFYQNSVGNYFKYFKISKKVQLYLNTDNLRILEEQKLQQRIRSLELSLQTGREKIPDAHMPNLTHLSFSYDSDLLLLRCLIKITNPYLISLSLCLPQRFLINPSSIKETLNYVDIELKLLEEFEIDFASPLKLPKRMIEVIENIKIPNIQKLKSLSFTVGTYHSYKTTVSSKAITNLSKSLQDYNKSLKSLTLNMIQLELIEENSFDLIFEELYEYLFKSSLKSLELIFFRFRRLPEEEIVQLFKSLPISLEKLKLTFNSSKYFADLAARELGKNIGEMKNLKTFYLSVFGCANVRNRILKVSLFQNFLKLKQLSGVHLIYSKDENEEFNGRFCFNRITEALNQTLKYK